MPKKTPASEPRRPRSKAETGSAGAEAPKVLHLHVADGVEKREHILVDLALAGDPGQRLSLERGEHADPHLYLGAHAAEVGGVKGTVIRCRQPGAVSAEVLLGDRGGGKGETAAEMSSVDLDLFAAWLPGRLPAEPYRLRFCSEDGSCWERDDPYRFAPTASDDDLYFFSEGTHRQLWRLLGAHLVEVDGVEGCAFVVWAPNARGVSVVGGFCGWNGRAFPMRRLGSSGLWELFVPGLGAGELYKFEILGPTEKVQRADPMASWAELSPGTASRTYRSEHRWGDGEWMAGAKERDVRSEPMAIYEVHLGSWRGGGGEPANYRELAPALVEHVQGLGFNYLELMPVAEHPFTGSWGYQITGYFAPTSRYGTPDDFRWFVDYCHRHGVGVILDWVPAHFVKDDHGLGRFDGTALYEHEDPRRGEHPDWGTYIFNYGRFEVRNFLVANALYWLDEFHIDGLRVDAVASMLYLDYSRGEGQWLPNAQGGRENLEAIALFREANRLVREHYPGRFLVAEESTAWPGITRDPEVGGLGFTLKWNMGWMHDTLGYFGTDPLFRSHQQDQLTFAMVYEYSEAFLNPLSHDEVVHGKGSLLARMPGDPWQKLANLRALLAYQYTRPGKQLLFMGCELAQMREWNHETGLDWFLRDDPGHAAFELFVGELGKLYQRTPSFWRLDAKPEGFEWIACHDRERSVLAYVRYASAPGAGHPSTEIAEHALVVLNLTPVPRDGYRLGAPAAGRYRVVLCSDDAVYGGRSHPYEAEVATETVPCDGRAHSLLLALPPLAAMVLLPAGSLSSRSGQG
ncbi:MAG: 1,4-alpha-glucan branching protein GlgB [Holophagales bacterium]|nr:1,4-alpha-glucan branching protein GlgB [Holophagales bacterium]